MAINEKKVWYGYLEAGNKSTLVALDPRLDTGNPETVYLFNLQKREILEYKRGIADPKLRELKPKETDSLEELKTAFAEARRTFKPRGAQVVSIPERGTVPAEGQAEAVLEEVADLDIEDEKEESEEDE